MELLYFIFQAYSRSATPTSQACVTSGYSQFTPLLPLTQHQVLSMYQLMEFPGHFHGHSGFTTYAGDQKKLNQVIARGLVSGDPSTIYYKF